jgi:DNA-binding beta-propeller fold protein YncE
MITRIASRRVVFLLLLALTTACGDILGPPSGAIKVDGIARSLLVLDGSLWVAVTDPTGTTGHVQRISLATRKTDAAAPVAAGPLQLVAASGSVWVATWTASNVVRIDPATMERRLIPLPGTAALYSISPAANGIWVRSGTVLYLLDPIRDEIQWTGSVKLEWGGPIQAGDRIFLSEASSGRLFRVSSGTLAVSDTVELGGAVRSWVFDGGSLWVSAASGQEAFIAQIDPASLSVLNRFPVTQAPGNLLAGGGYLWGVTNTDFRGTVHQIDPEAQRVVQSLRQRDRILDMAYHDGALWMAAPRYVHSIRS